MRKMIFLSVGWMRGYQGLDGDRIIGGGSFVDERGYGHEIFNFKPYRGMMYAYVQPTSCININRLGASGKDDSIDDILAVWVSKSPKGGVYVVGWYRNATVYRNEQIVPKSAQHKYKGDEFDYFIKAREKDCRLLPEDGRFLHVPSRIKGGFGQSHVWYAESRESEEFRKDVLGLVEKGRVPSKYKAPRPKEGRAWQHDPYKRLKVEKAAVEMTVKYFESLGYSVNSVEKDNVGWDLVASLIDRSLRLEVKGLSHEDLAFELTPNEYANMKKHKSNYRICVVTKALEKDRVLSVFRFMPDIEKWEDRLGRSLKITEIKSARVSL